jgi:hypothetical protein
MPLAWVVWFSGVGLNPGPWACAQNLASPYIPPESRTHTVHILCIGIYESASRILSVGPNVRIYDSTTCQCVRSAMHGGTPCLLRWSEMEQKPAFRTDHTPTQTWVPISEAVRFNDPQIKIGWAHKSSFDARCLISRH